MFIVIPRNGIQPGIGSLEIDFPNDVELQYDATCTAFDVYTRDELNCELTAISFLNLQKAVITHNYAGVDFSNTRILVEIEDGVINP